MASCVHVLNLLVYFRYPDIQDLYFGQSALVEDNKSQGYPRADVTTTSVALLW